MATETVRVWDENLGIHRKLFAGQVVPPDLIGAYKQTVNGEAARTDPDDTGENLESMKRTDLDALAANLGVDEPDKLGTKAAVIDAIEAARTDPDDE